MKFICQIDVLVLKLQPSNAIRNWNANECPLSAAVTLMEKPFVSITVYLYIADFIFTSQHMSSERSKLQVMSYRIWPAMAQGQLGSEIKAQLWEPVVFLIWNALGFRPGTYTWYLHTLGDKWPVGMDLYTMYNAIDCSITDASNIYCSLCPTAFTNGTLQLSSNIQIWSLTDRKLLFKRMSH